MLASPRQVLRSWWLSAARPDRSARDLNAEFPNRLATPLPAADHYPFRPLIVAVLLMVCLLPRAAMAWRLDAICPDGTFYIQEANALDRGDFAAGFQTMGINIYPVILVGLHKLGLGYELAGKLWNVAMATLVVLPLFGWVRRQFDDRIAAMACLLYAVNPKMIDWSPEIIREPTFWFLFTFSLYLVWRAVTEVRFLWFAAAGLAYLLVALTRFEGLFLWVPLVWWSVMRAKALQRGRARVVLGLLTALSIGPLLVVTVNLTLLHDHGRWEIFATAPLERFEHWVHAAWAEFNGPAVEAVVPEPDEPSVAPWMSFAMAWKFLDTMQRGISPLFGLLMFGGVAAAWKVWSRADQRPLFAVGLCVGGGIWIHLWYTAESSSRYPLSIVLLGTPYAAIGFLAFSRWLARRIEGGTFVPSIRAATAAVVLSVIGLVGTCDALTNNYDVREARCAVGRWIRSQYGPASVIVGSEDVAPLVAYYAEARACKIPLEAQDETVLRIVERNSPEAIVISSRQARLEAITRLMTDQTRLGVRQIDDQTMTCVEEADIIVLACFDDDGKPFRQTRRREQQHREPITR